MAEGWLRELAGGRFGVDSAGIEAHGQNPLALAVIAEAGVDISGQASTLLTDEQLQWADLVVTVCGQADESCPLLPSGTGKEHWPWTTRRAPKAPRRRSWLCSEPVATRSGSVSPI
jgi:arsenate reductase